MAAAKGLYALEFAQHGAEVIGIEGRLPSLAKAEFCRQVFGLENLRFVQGDVREADAAIYGTFDVVLCSGILYHLDQPAVFDVLKAMRAMCRGVLIIDTRVASTSETEAAYEGVAYRGSKYREHDPGASDAGEAGGYGGLPRQRRKLLVRKT